MIIINFKTSSNDEKQFFLNIFVNCCDFFKSLCYT